jgi:glycosyltransferase involved in cell wall biosynthesis
MKISVVLITLNEEANIEQCLEKLLFADEIVIVDSSSTDNTVLIAEKYGARVVQHPFENYGLQKQFAVKLAKNKWVLSLDADEVLSDRLVEEIKTISFSDTINGYLLPRTHVFLNKIFLYGSENKKPILRLFNKEKGNFTANKVHETIELDGRTMVLKNEMLHYTVSNFSVAIQKEIKYALLGGELFFEKNKKVGLLKLVFKLPFEFIRVYLFQQNLFNGFEGFVWSAIKAIGSLVKYVKLWQLNKIAGNR